MGGDRALASGRGAWRPPPPPPPPAPHGHLQQLLRLGLHAQQHRCRQRVGAGQVQREGRHPRLLLLLLQQLWLPALTLLLLQRLLQG